MNSPAFDGFSIIDLRHMSYAALTSYVVNKDSLAKLCDLYAAAIREGFRLPVDILVRDLVREGKLRAGCVFPFITSVRLEDIAETTMPDRPSEQSAVTAISLLRHRFYIQCDEQKCRALLDAVYPPRPLNELEGFISRLAGYMLLGNYRDF